MKMHAEATLSIENIPTLLIAPRCRESGGWIKIDPVRSSGTHTRWQLVSNDASGPPTLVDMGASFTIAPGGVLTLFIAASPNAGSVWVRVVDEVRPQSTSRRSPPTCRPAISFLAPRLFMNNGATAAAVAFDCSGLYLETDY